MASPKLFFLACALLVVQAQAHPQANVEGPVIDVIQRVVRRLEAIIDIIVGHVDGVIEDITRDPEHSHDKLIERADRILGIIWRIISRRLDGIRERSDPLTGHIISCIEDSRDQWKRVLLDFYGGTTGCLVPHLREVVRQARELRPDVQQLKIELFDAANRIQGCGGGMVDEYECALEVARDVLQVFRSARPEVIERAIALLHETVEVVRNARPTCISPNVDKLRAERSLVIKSVAACIVR